MDSIPTAQTLIDDAFSKARQAGNAQSFPDAWPPIKKKRADTKTRVNTAATTITDALRRVEDNVPNLGNLSEYHESLLRITVDIDEVRQCLAQLRTARDNIEGIAEDTVRAIHDESFNGVDNRRDEFFGRTADILESTDDALTTVRRVEDDLIDLPAIKGAVTAFLGFPNSGKSTTFTALTDRTVPVDVYPFTTTSVWAGTRNGDTVLDTPPVLHRDGARNDLEQRAYVTARYAADTYAFFISQEHSVERQKAFINETRRPRARFVVVDYYDVLSEEETFGAECDGILNETEDVRKWFDELTV